MAVYAITDDVIFQSSDFRLSNNRPFRVISDNSSKLISVEYLNWHGLISYTGVGRVWSSDTAKIVCGWISGNAEASSHDIAEIIAEKGSKWLRGILLRGRPHPHTFIIAGFDPSGSFIEVISNYVWS